MKSIQAYFLNENFSHEWFTSAVAMWALLVTRIISQADRKNSLKLIAIHSTYAVPCPAKYYSVQVLMLEKKGGELNDVACSGGVRKSLPKKTSAIFPSVAVKLPFRDRNRGQAYTQKSASN